LKTVTSSELSARIVFSGTSLSTQFNNKDRTKVEHQHDIIYELKCPEASCSQRYIGETARRLSVRVAEHGKDSWSNVFQHAERNGHRTVTMSNVNILGKNSKGTKHRKLLEALYIKRHKPQLNTQESSIPLRLF
jgi:hypothetical protein